MAAFFNPTPDERKVIEDIARGIPGVQQTFVANHPQLTRPDRGAHQQQLAASAVTFDAAAQLPTELDGLGIFQHGAAGRRGIGRISTGLGCPHAETEPDFLGLMVAFTTAAGRRIDFITINDPTSPTDTPEEFLALLQATADAAGTPNMFVQQAKLLVALARHAGLKAPSIGLHVTHQTNRTVRSSTAYQQYWTGVVRARDVLGKFTFVPTLDATTTPEGSARGPKHLSDDWRVRQSAGPLVFRLEWIPFLSERETPLADLTAPWHADHRVEVGTVTFPKIDSATREARLTALLASELGANAGNWDEVPEGPRAALPATRFTAARSLAYRESQKNRNALPEDAYVAFFTDGTLSSALEQELIRRYHDKRAAGHWVPDLGDF